MTEVDGELARAAACYAVHGANAGVFMIPLGNGGSSITRAWPEWWHKRWDKRDKHLKQGGRIRCLEIAGEIGGEVTVIDADIIIAHMLLWRERIGVRDLNRVRKNFDERKYDAYLDATSDGCVAACNHNPSLFGWTEPFSNVIARGHMFNEHNVSDLFTWRIPEAAREPFLRAVKKWANG